MPWRNGKDVKSFLSYGAALAADHDKLHLVFRNNSFSKLLYATYDGLWTNPVEIPNQTSRTAPDIAISGGKLHLVHLGRKEKQLWHSLFDGQRWTNNYKIPGQTSKARPGLSDFNGQLHMVHLGKETDKLWHSIYYAGKWMPNVFIEGKFGYHPPVLAPFNGLLHMIYVDVKHKTLMHCYFNGSSWSSSIKISDVKSMIKPAVSNYMGRLVVVFSNSFGTYTTWLSTSGSWENVRKIDVPIILFDCTMALFKSELHLLHGTANKSPGLQHCIGNDPL